MENSRSLEVRRHIIMSLSANVGSRFYPSFTQEFIPGTHLMGRKQGKFPFCVDLEPTVNGLGHVPAENAAICCAGWGDHWIFVIWSLGKGVEGLQDSHSEHVKSPATVE